jgi:S1-C subfamily serine protease
MKILLFALFLLFVPHSFCKAVLSDEEKRTIEVYQKSVPAVVNVSNVKVFTDFFSGGNTKQEVGTGTGFIWDLQGHIVTNYHVVEDQSSQFMISFYGIKIQSRAKIVGVEPKLDIAVLKVDRIPTNVKAIVQGSSNDLKVGQVAIAIGNPFGLDYTMTKGIVSALGRKIVGIGGVKINDMIQTDASINPGNSGGPLLNSGGELIGMNTMIFSNSGSNAGVGFAVPVDTINRVVPELIKYGKIIRPTIGIVPLPEEYAVQVAPKEKGVIVAYVAQNSINKNLLYGMRLSAQRELLMGDIIKKIDGKPIEDVSELYDILGKYKINDKVKLEIKRDNEKTIEVVVTLQAS